MKEKTLAIIPARGGSKRIPRKNIKFFLGNPIIKYSIEASLKSKCFDEVMISTDDKEIAKIAQKYRAKVPFYRSAKNSSDYATTPDVIEEVLKEYQKRGKVFKYCCCIYPTAPFVTAKKLKKGFEKLKKTSADSVVPIVRFSYPIQRALKIEKGKFKMIWPKNLNARSQDLMLIYHDAGQFYWLKVESFLKQKKLFAKHSVPIEVPESEVQDIDHKKDWKIAELKFKIFKKKV